MGVIKEGKDATGKCSRRGSNFSGQVEFLQLYWFSFWNTIWKASLKFVSGTFLSKAVAKTCLWLTLCHFPVYGICLGNMFISFLVLAFTKLRCHLERVIYFFAPLFFERLSGYKKSLELEPMILRLITVITGLCYSRKSYSLPVRLNTNGPWSKGIIKVCSFYKDNQ